MKSTTKTYFGYTAKRLMAWVSILCATTAIAVPALVSQSIDKEINEGLKMAGPAIISVVKYVNKFNYLPKDNANARYSSVQGKYVTSQTIENGVVKVLFNEEANVNLKGKTLSLTPLLDVKNHSVYWVCSSVVESKFLPEFCK